MRLAFVALAVGAALVSSALLLTGAWGEVGPPMAAAFVAEPLATATETPAPTATATLEPTATSTTSPTDTPVPPVLAPADSPQLETVATPIPPAPTDPPAPPPASCPSAALTGYAATLFNAINSERSANGMFSLGADGCAVYIAQLRSDDMASIGYFSHTSPSGQTAFSLLDAYLVPHGWAGENLARNNYPDGETVGVAIRDLMASSGHRANILSANYTTLGVAVAFDGAGMKYFTMVFIGPP
ncbi:MAG: hypothetical protein J4N95_02440 [Chloroflexi bacterium]|nr:hypothetical protein [Chloroflexota bacterium]